VLGFSLLQAAVLGGAVGAIVSARPVPRPGFRDEEVPRPGVRTVVGWPIDALERVLLDWRLRELARRNEPARDVVLVGVDDETLASAREDAHAELGSRPWPRALLGRLVTQLGREGASPVLLDWPLDWESPRQGGEVPDDELFRRGLDAGPATTVLGFSVAASPSPGVVRPLRPSLVLIGIEGTEGPGTAELLRRVLADHRPAFAISEGGRTRVWAGVASEEEGRQVAKRLGVTGTPVVRDFAAADRAFQVTAEDLLVRLAEVEVTGVEVEHVPVVRSLDVPAAVLLGLRSRYGHTALAVDGDGRVRGIQHLVRWVSPQGRSHVLPSLALAGALARAGTRQVIWSDGRLEVVGGRSIPTDATGYGLLRWDAAEAGRDGRGSLERAISSWRFLQNLYDAAEGVPPHARNDVQGRAAVLSETFRGAGEWPATPLGPGVSHAAVVGQGLENWLDGAGIARAPVRQDVLFTFALAFLGGFLALGFSGVFRSFIGGVVYVGTAVLAVAGWLVWVRHVFIADGKWVAAAGPLVAFGLAWLLTTRYALRTERQMRDFVYGALGRYVSPDIADQVFRNVALMRPQRREVTLCYADLEAFRALDQALPPDSLVELLNAYFGELTHLVRQTGGHVEYVGDALIAFWGAPVRLERHAAVACRTALAIRRELARLGPDWQRKFGADVRARMALHSGVVVAGDMGSPLKSNYTVLGEPVAVVGRLERANRRYGTSILASADTVRRAGDEFVFRELDQVGLNGGTMTLHELIGRPEEVPAVLLPVLAGWPQALAQVRRREFAPALAFFESHAEVDPVSARWAERVRGYVAAPPPADWDGRGDLRSTG